ncbi:MAG: ribokinase [Lautropia sp.]
MADLIVVGSYNLDVGIAVSRFPQPGETVLARDTFRSHGGKGSNQAVQASRCGARVAMLAAVGDDAAGAEARALWQGESIDASAVVAREGVATGAAFITIDDRGENQIVVAPGANATLSPDDVGRAGDLIGASRLVLAQLEVPHAAVAAAFRIARAAGATTVLNAAPAGDALPPALLALTDLLIVNETEAAALAAVPSADGSAAAAVLVQRVALGVIVTLGANGVRLRMAGGPTVHLDAAPVTVVDSTGAGDAFTGAFASAWVRDRDALGAARLGVAAGAHACTARGAVASFGRFG